MRRNHSSVRRSYAVMERLLNTSASVRNWPSRKITNSLGWWRSLRCVKTQP